MLDNSKQGLVFLENQAIENEQGYVRGFEYIGEASHERTGKECSQGHSMAANELL